MVRQVWTKAQSYKLSLKYEINRKHEDIIITQKYENNQKHEKH